jgi:hypothetical protein
MAKAVLKVGRTIKNKSRKMDKVILGVLIVDLLVTASIALKVFGVM